jgi:putative DNA methylase
MATRHNCHGLGGEGFAHAYADAVATYLGFVVSRLANYSSTLCVWSSHPKDELTKQVFLRQAFPMTWDFSEANPFASSGGTLDSCIDFTARAVSFLRPSAAGSAFQMDARRGEFEGRVISTDPPYFDNISYSELSDFFYVWLRNSLQCVHPELFSTLLTPKADELIASPFRHGGREKAETFFRTGIEAVICGIARAAKRMNNTCTIYYAFKQAETSAVGTSSTGWSAFLQAVYDAGLGIEGTWPIRTELITSLKKNVGALASSIVLVCRPRDSTAGSITGADLRRALRAELPRALKLMKLGNIAPVDVAQASVGPGMAVFSRHSKVLEADGSAMTVRSALQLINEVLDEYLTSSEGDFDAATRFAITWYEQHGWETGPFGEAETLSKARNVSVGGVMEAGICKSGGGKVRILKRSEMRSTDYDPRADKRPTIWEFTQHLIRCLEDEGEESAGRFLQKLGPSADATRELAYRLYNTCERKKWAEDARSYNGLILAWPELEKLAARLDDEVAGEPVGKSGKKGAKKKALAPKGQGNLFGGDDE